MGRGIVAAETLRTEQFEFEARTSDPTDAQPGEYWIRTDQTGTDPDVVAELRRQDQSGVTGAPIFAASEESNLGSDVKRGPSVVLDDGSVGFVAMTTGDGAVGSPRAVTAAGTQYVSHDGLELSPTPDTSMFQDAVYQYYAGLSTASDGTTASFPEGLAGLSDAAANSDPKFNSNFNGFPAFEYDGGGDSHSYNVNGSITDTNYSVAILFYQPSSFNTDRILVGFDSTSYAIGGDGAVTVNDSSTSDPGRYGNVQIGQWSTTGFSFNGSTINHYLDGSNLNEASYSTNNTPEDTDRLIADGTQLDPFDGYIAEVVFTNATESDQAFSDYHTNRLG